MTSRDDVSDPSTASPNAALLRAITPLSQLSWIKPWMLDPEGAYPFVEWEDLSRDQRALHLGHYAAQAIASLPEPLMPPVLDSLVRDIKRIAASRDNHRAAVRETVMEAVSAAKASQQMRDALNTSPRPAKPGHLMAEGSVLSRARKAASSTPDDANFGVHFNEPVNAFTMMCGRQIAEPGDMLTAVTIEDTTEHQINSISGTVTTVYRTRAIYL